MLRPVDESVTYSINAGDCAKRKTSRSFSLLSRRCCLRLLASRSFLVHSRSPKDNGRGAGKGNTIVMDSFLSIFPKNLFGCNNAGMETIEGESSLASSLMLVEENGRKRARRLETRDSTSGCMTPTLASTPRSSSEPQLDGEEEDLRPIKRFRGEHKVIPVSPVSTTTKVSPENTKKEEECPSKKTESKSPLSKLPEDVLSHCLSFLGSAEDRFSLQCTSKQFQKISNSDDMLRNIQVGGDKKTGLHGIIQESDTPESASKALKPFADAGNLEAIYM